MADDIWDALLRGHTATMVPSAIDMHLSGKAHGEDFEGVRQLTDKFRQANALGLPVEAGARVTFTGSLGAVLSLQDPPPEGMSGEVVSVKSANGDITDYEGRVFVKFDDGQTRSVHAEFLRRDASSKTAAYYTPKVGDRVKFKKNPKKMGEVVSVVTSPKVKAMVKLDSGPTVERGSWDLEPIGKKASVRVGFPTGYRRQLNALVRNLQHSGAVTLHKDGVIFHSHGSVAFKRNALEEELAALDLPYGVGRAKKIFGDFGSEGPGEPDEYLFFPLYLHRIRAASLGDLTQFLKVADGKLIHKSTKDLWSFKKDADGNLTVERLFDDNGEPLKEN